MRNIPIFFISLVVIFSFNISFISTNTMAQETNKQISLIYNDNVFFLNEKEFQDIKKFKFSNHELLKKVKNMGFSDEDCVNYVYPNLKLKINEICEKINKEAISSSISVESGAPIVNKEQVGEVVNLDCLYNDLFTCLLLNKNAEIEIKVDKINPDILLEDNLMLTNEKSSFTTYINGVNQEGRIQNIKRALEQFNGMVIMPNESVSFNKTIGETTKENGYSLAKVILNGKYTDDYGGGVCQAATTLYNSALIAGLEIEKVRPHSLKVGYVLGSFDAMVSAGVSDLVIKNPYKTPVFVHTYSTDAECGVKIFGEQNEFEIKRRNEKVEFDETEFPEISYKSEGFLDYFKNGELIKSQKIRQDAYKKVKVEESI